MHRSVEQNRVPQNKPKCLWSINIQQRGAKPRMESKSPLKQMVWGGMDSYMQKNETQPPSYTIRKSKLKMDKRLKYNS